MLKAFVGRSRPVTHLVLRQRCLRSYAFGRGIVKTTKTTVEVEDEKLQANLQSKDWIVRWGARFRSKEFRKSMTKYYIGIYVIFLVYGTQVMKRLYLKDKELESLRAKSESPEGLNEFETLRIKELTGKLRTRDRMKLDKYRAMDLDYYDGIVIQDVTNENDKEAILPARDTTEFYEHKAEEYDKAVNKEERAILMGGKRKWAARQCQGDVLEVSCGTGRNIKYFDMQKINSITFVDSSYNMMEITRKKFKNKNPRFQKVAYVVGKAEHLLDSEGDPMKYDTIIQTFGLCSHEDPVKALQNYNKLLKPGGRIVLLEHGRSNHALINKILDKRAAGRLEQWGCRWNLDIGEILDDSGLDIVEEKRVHLGSTWCIVAKKPGDSRRAEEIGFFEKYIQSGIKEKVAETKQQ